MKKPIEYRSCSSSSTEREYDATQGQSLSVVWAVLLLRTYPKGRRTRIRTDHGSQKLMLNPSHSSIRLRWWRLRLLKLDFNFVHPAKVSPKWPTHRWDYTFMAGDEQMTHLYDALPTRNVDPYRCGTRRYPTSTFALNATLRKTW